MSSELLPSTQENIDNDKKDNIMDLYPKFYKVGGA